MNIISANQTSEICLDKNLTDLIKFLACLMIALHHYSQGMVVAGTHNPIYLLFSTQGGWLGVAIFFFLSGYGLMNIDMKNHQSPIQFFKINVPVVPKWIGGTSYDVYLVHNKALMLLRPTYAIVPLWMFVGITALFTISFHNFRKSVKINVQQKILSLCDAFLPNA